MMDIRNRTAQLLKVRFEIEEKVTLILFEEGILQEHDLRNVLIKAEYDKRVGTTGKQILKNHLADKFCVSVASIEKIVAR